MTTVILVVSQQLAQISWQPVQIMVGSQWLDCSTKTVPGAWRHWHGQGKTARECSCILYPYTTPQKSSLESSDQKTKKCPSFLSPHASSTCCRQTACVLAFPLTPPS